MMTAGIELLANGVHDHKHRADDTAEANSRISDSKRHGGTVCGLQSRRETEDTECRHGQQREPPDYGSQRLHCNPLLVADSLLCFTGWKGVSELHISPFGGFFKGLPVRFP